MRMHNNSGGNAYENADGKNNRDEEKKQMKRFRVHHIMCTDLYQGYGYSGAFCENMTEMVTWLKEHADEKLLLVSDPDEICKKCPNLKDDVFCVDETNHVKSKDQQLLEPLHLLEKETYSYEELQQHAKQYLTKEVFEASCRNCQWYKKGLCRYEDFRFC